MEVVTFHIVCGGEASILLTAAGIDRAQQAGEVLQLFLPKDRPVVVLSAQNDHPSNYQAARLIAVKLKVEVAKYELNYVPRIEDVIRLEEVFPGVCEFVFVLGRGSLGHGLQSIPSDYISSSILGPPPGSIHKLEVRFNERKKIYTNISRRFVL